VCAVHQPIFVAGECPYRSVSMALSIS
jgi:hypothetical protein